MNSKIFVFIAVLALAGILGGILLVGPTMTAPGQGNNDTAENAPAIKLVTVELEDISVTKINERSATIEIAFEISNPNPRAVIIQTMDFNLFETGFSSHEQLAGGTIGSRPEGMVEFGSNYYTLLGENSIVLKTPKMGFSDNFSRSHVPVDRSTPSESGDTITFRSG